MPKKKQKSTRYSARRPDRNPGKRNATLRRIFISLLIVAIVASTIYFLILRKDNNISIAENGIGSLITPVQNAFTSATRGIQEFFTRWHNYDKLQVDYDKLSQENQQLSMELVNAEEALNENERLKSLLDAKSNYEALDPIYAKVIAHDAGQWFHTFSINRGQSQGVTVGMAVVNGDGLVGRVYEAGLNYAKVISIIDTRSAVACLVQRTRDNGILHGNVYESDDTAECYVYYLPNVNNIVPGDIVVTSGTDSMYPKGLRIGQVTSISLNAGSEGNYAIVAPMVDFLHIEEVFVLRTVIETDTDVGLPSLPTPIPTPIATPSPTPLPDAAATLGPNTAENWQYPSANSPNGDILVEPLLEDTWAEN